MNVEGRKASSVSFGWTGDAEISSPGFLLHTSFFGTRHQHTPPRHAHPYHTPAMQQQHYHLQQSFAHKKSTAAVRNNKWCPSTVVCTRTPPNNIDVPVQTTAAVPMRSSSIKARLSCSFTLFLGTFSAAPPAAGMFMRRWEGL